MADEKIIGSIGVYKFITKISFVTTDMNEIYQLLCFTPKRIIVAETGRFIPIENWKISDLFWTKSHYRLRELNAPRRVEAREQAAIKAGGLVRLPVERILESNKANFPIAYEEIVKVTLQKPDKLIGWPLTITTSINKYRYPLINKDEYNQLMDLLRSILSDKLTVSQT